MKPMTLTEFQNKCHDAVPKMLALWEGETTIGPAVALALGATDFSDELPSINQAIARTAGYHELPTVFETVLGAVSICLVNCPFNSPSAVQQMFREFVKTDKYKHEIHRIQKDQGAIV